MPIEKELWVDIIKEQPIQEGDFLNESEDLSALVDNNTLHLAEAGVEPEVFIDNDTYPVGIVQREDVPKDILLHTLDTKNTVVRNIEQMQAAYDKMLSVTRGHVNALTRKRRAMAAYNWCPLQNGEFTPVLETTGELVNGRRRLTFDDLDLLEAKFKAMEVDMTQLCLVLTTEHEADLKSENRKLYKEYMRDGKIGNFKVFSYPHLPLFDTTTGKKQAFGAQLRQPALDERDGVDRLDSDRGDACDGYGRCFPPREGPRSPWRHPGLPAAFLGPASAQQVHRSHLFG